MEWMGRDGWAGSGGVCFVLRKCQLCDGQEAKKEDEASIVKYTRRSFFLGTENIITTICLSSNAAKPSVVVKTISRLKLAKYACNIKDMGVQRR